MASLNPKANDAAQKHPGQQHQDPKVENLDINYAHNYDSANFMVEDKDKTTYSIQEESVQKLNPNLDFDK